MMPPQTSGVYLALFADDTCLYATDRKEDFVVRKVQCGLNSMEPWCECRNIKINEDKTQGIYLSRSHQLAVSHLTLNWRDIPFVNSVKYLSSLIRKLHGIAHRNDRSQGLQNIY
jgi:hypothetical protein